MDWAYIIDQSVEYIESHILEDIAIEDIARNVGLSSFIFKMDSRCYDSPDSFSKAFSRSHGINPNAKHYGSELKSR